MHQWEAELREFDRTYKTAFSEDEKVSILAHVAPKELQQSIFMHSDALDNYSKIREYIEQYLINRNLWRRPQGSQFGLTKAANKNVDNQYDDGGVRPMDIGGVKDDKGKGKNDRKEGKGKDNWDNSNKGKDNWSNKGKDKWNGKGNWDNESGDKGKEGKKGKDGKGKGANNKGGKRKRNEGKRQEQQPERRKAVPHMPQAWTHCRRLLVEGWGSRHRDCYRLRTAPVAAIRQWDLCLRVRSALQSGAMRMSSFLWGTALFRLLALGWDAGIFLWTLERVRV